jgi:acyl-coenzyme A thioesterase PaaI-like protein
VAALRSVKNSRLCFGCGPENDAGLRLTFESGASGRLRTRFVPREIHGGWEGVFHGGLMATLLDEAMMAYLFRNGIHAATADLHVRFRKPVRLGEELVVEAWEEARRGRLIRMTAEARRRGVLVARASARCLEIPEEGTDS